MLKYKLHHIAIYTKDIKRSLDFYTTVLQAEVLWDGEAELPTGKIRAAMLKIGDFQLELVVPLQPWDSERQKGPIQHFTLQVDNVREAENTIKQAGLVNKAEPVSRLVAFGKVMEHAFIYGPDDERIELVEEL